MPLLVVPVDHPVLWLFPVLAALGLGFALVRAARGLSATGPRDMPAAFEVPESDRSLAAVVINPSKFEDPDQARTLIAQECRVLGWREPVFLETTEVDSGRGQTRQALDLGAEAVLACGGDGTVRLVAQELAGTGVPMGILPAGAGNLLARNLDIPLNDVTAAVRVALTGTIQAIDMGWVQIDERPQEPFLVMTGMGFDGEIMADTDGQLKQKVGAAAYVAAGARRLTGQRTLTRITVDGTTRRQRVRSVIIGNCGRLQAGIELMPDARIDDGLLDMVSLSPRGVVGWGAVSLAVLTKKHFGHTPVTHAQGERIKVRSSTPLIAQVDGDAVGEAVRLRTWLTPGALQVRVGEPVQQAAR